MKVLHTGDWHVGKHTHGTFDVTEGLNTRSVEMRDSLLWLTDVIEEEKPDVVVHTGDMGDSPFLSGSELDLIAQFARRCGFMGVPVIGDLGNHDLEGHPKRKSVIQSVFPEFASKVIRIPVNDWSFIMVPYPRRSALAAAGITFETAAHYMAEEIALRAGGQEWKSIVVGHFSMTGARFNEEQNPMLMTGQDFVMPKELLMQEGVYGAMLGHIHAHQTHILKDNFGAIYSGSLMRLGFGEEENQPEGVCIWELDKFPFTVRRIDNPHSPQFLTMLPDESAYLLGMFPESVEGAYVRVKSPTKISESDKQAIRQMAVEKGCHLTAIIEERQHTVRQGAKRLAAAQSDEAIAIAYAEELGESERSDELLSLMKEVDEV